jgi:hypothetical protein
VPSSRHPMPICASGALDHLAENMAANRRFYKHFLVLKCF